MHQPQQDPEEEKLPEEIVVPLDEGQEPGNKPQPESILKPQPLSTTPIGTGVVVPVSAEVEATSSPGQVAPIATLPDPVSGDWETEEIQALSPATNR